MLDEARIKFVQRATNFNEDQILSTDPTEFVYQATKGKLQSAIKQFGLDLPILCADSVVAVENKILRKAKDINNARELLQKQSGNKVEIITCTTLYCSSFELIDLSKTSYLFAPFNEEKLAKYLDSGEWQGKAGACMVEGFCKEFIVSVDGYESTAKGVTLEAIFPFLDKLS